MSAPTSFAFLHGGGQGSWVWDETIAALDSQTAGAFSRALALDVPGCGRKRDRNTEHINVDDIARELIADIDGARMKDVVLVGHSQAGNVLPRMVGMRPDLFRRLVYVSCSIPLPGQTVQQMMGDGLHGSNPNEIGWPVDPKTTDMRQRFPAMFCNDMSAGERASFMAKLGKDAWPMQSYAETNWECDHFGAVPASYVVCLRDAILPVAWQKTFAARYKTERQIRIDAGHQAMNTRPHALAEILLREAD